MTRKLGNITNLLKTITTKQWDSLTQDTKMTTLGKKKAIKCIIILTRWKAGIFL